jgi:hypothetical protein
LRTKSLYLILTQYKESDVTPARLQSNYEWSHYFESNRGRLMHIPWELGVRWTEEEHAALAASLQEFQLGESGEGRHFKRCAAAYAARTGDVDYERALALFIAEEQRHARDLGRVLDLAGVGRATKSTVNSAFCGLRRLAGLELIVTVLVTAELVAQVYYKAIFQATTSAVLRALCRQILRDEVQHVRFQCQQLARMRERRPRVLNAMSVAAHFGLMLATSAVVWFRHGRAVRRGGIGYVGFVASLVRRFGVAKAWMTPPVPPRPVAACKLAAPPIQPPLA